MSAVRDYRERDLGRVVELWERENAVPVGPDGLTVDEAMDLMASSDVQVLVAEERDLIVGVVVGAVNGPVGTVFRLLGRPDVTGRLLDELEALLAERGARKLAARLHHDHPLRDQLIDRGFQSPDGTILLEREVAGTIVGPRAVAELGGQMVPSGLWDELEGMETPKRLIERRVLLPLEQAELADRHGISPPRAIVLFGPPGTGKTTFARGVASRLGWPFVPIGPASLGDDSEDEARALAGIFDRLLELPSAVGFVDEVEEIASTRRDGRRVSRRVTNEFLRQIPRLRDAAHHLLVCATNTVSRLDPAFLRPGRFDYVLPVGPPDEAAREAMWRRYVDEITDHPVDIDTLVEASERFTVADIEFAAHKAAQLAFERELFDEVEGRATTDDFLKAIQQTRPTLSKEMIETFEHDLELFARS